MTKFMQGDLFEADVDALVNTVNCVGIMGKGVALQFKRRFPEMFSAYKAACDRGEVQLGRMFVYETHQLTGPRFIVNFPTKGHWKSKSRLSDIETGLIDLRQVIADRDIASIAMPPLGAGNGGLYWPTVRALIQERLADVDAQVLVYEPSGHTVYAVEGARNIRMTRARALVLQLIERYSERKVTLEPWTEAHAASHLELQKLLYIADVIDPSLDMRFVRGIYGPYSERVRHVIGDMEGRFVKGYGDGTGAPLSLDPISVTDEGARELRKFLVTAEGTETAELVERVLVVTHGYESAYGVELLASTLLCAAEFGPDVDVVSKEIQTWNPRKARLFKPSHVSKAIDHLEHAAL